MDIKEETKENLVVLVQEAKLDFVKKEIESEQVAADENLKDNTDATADKNDTLIKDNPNQLIPGKKRELELIKEDNLDNGKRRRSLRNETAATIKKKPPKYEEIFNCYKRKEYKECIIYIDLVAETAKEWIEYQVLKAACLIHLGVKLAEAHKILDDILKVNNLNAFVLYAKGLAYYQEEKWSKCIKYFEKAINMDKNSMERAEVLLGLAREEYSKVQKVEEILPMEVIKKEQSDTEEVVDEISSNHEEVESQSETNTTPLRTNRFRCELCDKHFCKKFNLDRHNKVMHNRATPYIPPLPRNYHYRRSAPEPIPIKVEEKSPEVSSPEVASPSLSPSPSKPLKFKIKFNKKIKRTQSLSAIPPNCERCKICKKLYRKGSLARHEVIHTGNLYLYDFMPQLLIIDTFCRQ